MSNEPVSRKIEAKKGDKDDKEKPRLLKKVKLKNIFIIWDGLKKKVDKKSLGIVVITSSVFAMIAVLFISPAPEMNIRATLDTPKMYSINSKSIRLQTYTRHADEQAKKNQQNSKQNKYRPKIIVSSLEVLKREGSDLIPPGTTTVAKFRKGASNGAVEAVLTEELSFNGEVFATSETILLGNGASTENRLIVNFTTMVHPDGRVQKIKAKAFDPKDKMLGIRGSRVGHYASKMVASTGLNFVGGVAAGLRESEVRDGIAVEKSNMKNALLQGAGTAALEQSRELMENMKNKPLIIEVDEGTKLFVTFY